MQCWHYFSYTYFWFGYLVGVTCSRSQEVKASCVLYIICSQFITFKQVMLISAYCAWFVALLVSPYAVLLRTCPYFQFELRCLCNVGSENGDHVIS